MDYETAVEFGLIPDVMSQNVFNASYFADGYNGVADFVLKRTQEILVSDNIRDKIMRFANERIYRDRKSVV